MNRAGMYFLLVAGLTPLGAVLGQNMLIGVFEGVELQMGCTHEFAFRLCSNCVQSTEEVESEADILALRQGNWTEQVFLTGLAGTDCGMNSEDGEEQVLLWEDCCSPVSDDRLLDHLPVQVGQLCAVYLEDLVLLSREDMNQPGFRISGMRLLRKDELRTHFVRAYDYDDW